MLLYFNHTHYYLGACNKIIKVDSSRRAQSMRAESDFHTKCISVHNMPEPVLEQIHKFPFPIQELIVGEAHAMTARIESGKLLPGLQGPECHCQFFICYSCHHILQEHLFGGHEQPFLLDDAWKTSSTCLRNLEWKCIKAMSR